MPISIDCPCGKRLLLSDKLTARQGLCPSCGRTLDLPDTTTAPEAPLSLRAVEVPSPRTADREDRGQAPGGRAPRAAPAPDGRWQPPPGTVGHDGKALPPDADFFVPPPAEVGEIVSAYTTLRTGARPTAPTLRAATVIVCGAAGLAIGLVVAVLTENSVVFALLGVPLGGVGVWLGIHLTRFQHRCTYVGREGVARYGCSGSREKIEVREVFRFRDAAELLVSQTSRYVNGVYSGTQYSYSWNVVGGQLWYRIAGTHRCRDNPPPAGEPYRYALAAEAAWSNYLLAQVRTRLLMSETVPFSLGGSDWVRLGQRQLILCLKGQTIECDVEDIAEMRLHQGWFEVRRKDAQRGWFSSTGVFKFPYAHLANAQLFLFLLDQLLGLRFS